MYTRQSVKRPGDDPAVTSCALQRTLCTEFIRSKTWDFWYPIAERFDDEGESGATLERPGLAKLLRRIEDGDIHRVIVYRVDRLTRKLADLARLIDVGGLVYEIRLVHGGHSERLVRAGGITRAGWKSKADRLSRTPPGSPRPSGPG